MFSRCNVFQRVFHFLQTPGLHVGSLIENVSDVTGKGVARQLARQVKFTVVCYGFGFKQEINLEMSIHE